LGSLGGAGQLRPEHTDVVRPAVGRGALGASGHVAMVAAVQPFVSGGVAKTVNLPPRATVEDFEAVFLEDWRRGLKGVTVYRQQSKILQPVRGRRQTRASTSYRWRAPKERPAAAEQQ
jgi:ribonucleoside-diphosphate reductase alpha chain